MTVMQDQAFQKAELWQEYRRAFEEFSETLRRVQSLTSALGCDQVALETALLELEKARVRYSGRRDALVEHFLPSSIGDVVLGWAPRVFPQANEDRGSGIPDIAGAVR
jgi:hypothetical protein